MPHFLVPLDQHPDFVLKNPHLKTVELTQQERQFYEMSEEFTCYEKSKNTLRYFLSYCPDSLSYLLDRCLIAHEMQIQGNVYLDLFLFCPSKFDSSPSEIKMVELLLQSGKERFLIHPLVEIFLKLKWQIIWKLYLVSVLFFATFFASLSGFAITNYGVLWGSQSNNRTRDTWW